MKIAFIVGTFPALSETFILNQITGLIDLGHTIEIFAHSKPNEKKVHDQIQQYSLIEKVHYFNKPANRFMRVLQAPYFFLKNFQKGPIEILRSLNAIKYGRNAFSLDIFYYALPFLETNFDIIHCHFGPNGIIGISLRNIGIHGKLITSFHGHDINTYPRLFGKNVYKVLFKEGDVFTANTNFTKEQMINVGCQGNKINILPVGLKIEKFKYIERSIPEDGKVNILTVGRLVEKKGHEYVIKAIAKICAKNENLVYYVAGDGPLRKSLECLVEELGIQNKVYFLGPLQEKAILKLYEQAHIFILASVTAKDGDREGQGLVLQEAQASGLPVISTLHNGIPEGIVNGNSGFLVPEKNVDMLAEKIEYLIDHPELWPEMGKCGRKFVEERYNINTLNLRLTKIYSNLLC